MSNDHGDDIFIKYIRDSDKASWLRSNYPNAYLLLSVIAESARRHPDILDGLEIGDVIVSELTTPKKAGISKKAYRNAIDKLEELKFIETVWNPKNTKQQKRAIKRAIKSKVVCLIDSDIWDINPTPKGDQKGDQRANKGRLTKNVKECKEEESKILKKERSPLAIALLDEFYKSLLVALPSFNQSKLKKTDAQISAMERLLPVHGEEKVRQVFIYAHTSSFWKAHVHTAVYLEKKFETLMAQIEPQKGNQYANHSAPAKQSSDTKPRGPLRARNVLKAVPGDS